MSRVIVAGAGRVGARATRVLADYGYDIAVVERDEDRAAAVDDAAPVVVEGDATEPGVLREAGLDRADAVAALAGRPATNLAVCATVEEVTDARTVARVERADRQAPVADETVVPERVGGKATVDRVLGDRVAGLADALDGMDAVEVRVDPRAPAAGRRLADVSVPAGARVVARADDGSPVDPDTRLRGGEGFVVAVERGAGEQVRRLLLG